jgi:hypothetical protein
MVDTATMQGLNIFSEERHPSHMGIGSNKEGFSLFGMLNKCITNMVRAACVGALGAAPICQAMMGAGTTGQLDGDDGAPNAATPPASSA